MYKEQIILVHGTGAADESAVGNAWWQVTSRFHSALKSAVENSHELAPPFHWSGANSEVARLEAARALLIRLRDLDAEGARYHLIGHSHGGSLIWQALVDSMRVGPPLRGLGSWSTVGTPFLEFRPILPSLSRWFALVSSLILVSWMLIAQGDIREWPKAIYDAWGGGRQVEIALWSIGWLALFGLLAAAGSRVLLPYVRWGRERAEAFPAEKRAAATYGERWLGLWHPLDEPINGLASTLGDAPPISPRLRGGARIFALIPVLGPASNKIVIRAADEFVWTQIARRAQGANRPGFDLVSVGRAPLCLRPGFHALNHEAADLIEEAANAKAPATVARLRTVLARGFDAQASLPVLSRAVTIVSFQELIHTSYFDHDSVGLILSSHIRQFTGVVTAPPSGASIASGPARVSVGFTPKLGSAKPRRNLEFMAAICLSIVPVALVSQAVIGTLFNSAIRPETLTYQLEAMSARLAVPPGSSEGSSSDVYGAVIARLARLNVISDPVSALSKLAAAGDRSSGVQPLLRWLGEQGNWAAIEGVRISPHLAGRSSDTAPLNVVLENLVSALEGVAGVPIRSRSSEVVRGQVDALVTEMALILRDGVRSEIADRFYWERAVNVVFALGEGSRLDRLLGEIGAPDQGASPRTKAICSVLLGLSRADPRPQRVQWLMSWVSACRPATDVPALLIPAYLNGRNVSLREPIDQFLENDGAPTQQIENILFDMKKQISRSPQLSMNTISRRRLQRLIYHYVRADEEGNSGLKKEIKEAFVSKITNSTETVKSESAIIALNFFEQLQRSAPPLFNALELEDLASLLLVQMRRETQTIVDHSEMDNDSDDHAFARLSRLLDGLGRRPVAQQYLIDVNAAGSEYQGSVGAGLKIALAHAAHRIGYRSLADQLLDQAQAVLVEGFANGKVSDPEVAKLALQAERVARPFDRNRANNALSLGDAAVLRLDDQAELSSRLPELVQAWASRGAFAKARLRAEMAKSQREVLFLYLPILDELIARGRNVH